MIDLSWENILNLWIALVQQPWFLMVIGAWVWDEYNKQNRIKKLEEKVKELTSSLDN